MREELEEFFTGFNSFWYNIAGYLGFVAGAFSFVLLLLGIGYLLHWLVSIVFPTP